MTLPSLEKELRLAEQILRGEHFEIDCEILEIDNINIWICEVLKSQNLEFNWYT
jgi:hypothetical protein